MLSYLHSFHAGNHADILKHVTLLYVLEYLNKKNKPYSFFDTHAGRALYDLQSDEANKTGEAQSGIIKLLKIAAESCEENQKENSRQSTNETLFRRLAENFPQELNSYVNFVKSYFSKGFYPGSPAFEIALSKKGSFVSLSELHKTEFEALKKNVEMLNPECFVNEINASGWETLRKNVPPKINRGAILCDPSYEELSDFSNAAENLSFAHKKWSAGTILLWYPLLANKIDEIENMKQAILATVKNRDIHTEVLDAKLLVDTEESHAETSLENSIGSEKPRLYGSGMFVVRPSWGLKEHLEKILPFLAQILGRNGNGSFGVEMF